MPALSSIKFSPRRLSLVPVDAPAPDMAPTAPQEPESGFMELVVVENPVARKRGSLSPVRPQERPLQRSGPTMRPSAGGWRKGKDTKPHEPFWVRTTLIASFVHCSRAGSSADWMPEADRLERILSSMHLPNHPVRLDGHTTIVNPQAFIEGHLGVLRAYKNSGLHAPYHDRLMALEAILLSPCGNMGKPSKHSKPSNENTIQEDE